MDYAVSTAQKVKVKVKEGKMLDKYLTFTKSWKAVKHECDSYTNRRWGPLNSPQQSEKELDELKISQRIER